MEYAKILNGVKAYENGELQIVSGMVIAFFIILGIVAFRNHGRQFKEHKTIITIIFAVFLVCYLGCLINYLVSIRRINSDISEEKYIRYEGSFSHDNYQKDSFYHNLYIYDGDERILLKFSDYSNHSGIYSEILPVGDFYGSIVYSEQSRIVVDWEIKHIAN